MRPYADLPISSRMKDHLLIVIALGLAAHHGLPIAKDLRLVYV
jgi:hypothetical protein